MKNNVCTLLTQGKEVWNKEKYAWVNVTRLNNIPKKPLWVRILGRLLLCWYILTGRPMVYYDNTKHKYFKKYRATKVEHIVYFKKPKKKG